MVFLEKTLIYEQKIIPFEPIQDVVLKDLYYKNACVRIILLIAEKVYQITFNQLDAFRVCEESVLLTRDCKGSGIFIIKNSYFVSDFKKQASGTRDDTNPIHYRVETFEDVVDILTYTAPKLDVLSENELT